MNTLAYGLLSLLSQSPGSGYDLMLKMQPFWPAKHSQIYPLLAQLESKEYVRHVHIAQSDKPDKKVYSLTEEGKAALRSWLAMPADVPVTRDELSLKIYCMSEGDSADIERLLEMRVSYCKDRIDWLREKMEKYAGIGDGSKMNVVLLIEKARFSIKAELEWSEWALAQLKEDR